MEITIKPGFLTPRAQSGSAAAAAETTSAIVLAQGIHKTYDSGAVKTHALRGVDLSVERGEMVAIMGPSGCGKTTLLNCLAGLEDFDQGAIYIDGTPLKGMSDNKKTEYRARQMGQQPTTDLTKAAQTKRFASDLAYQPPRVKQGG